MGSLVPIWYYEANSSVYFFKTMRLHVKKRVAHDCGNIVQLYVRTMVPLYHVRRR